MGEPLKGTSARPPRDLVLQSAHIRLQPLVPEQDCDELLRAASGNEQKDAIWAYMFFGPFHERAAFMDYLQQLYQNEGNVPFVVVDISSNAKIGIVTFMNISPTHRTIEIGNIWYTTQFQRSYANTESSYLLIKYAFEELQYRRVEWKCDNTNERSKKAATRLGFTFEGILRQHFILKGRNRDTAYFSILDGEWAKVKNHLEGLMQK